MKQLTFIKKGKLEWHEVSEPKIENPTDAIVRPFIAARCDLDAGFLHHDIYGKYRIGKLLGLTDEKVPEFTRPDVLKGPFPMGHECVAEIVELGKELTGFRKGQKVVIPFQVSCGTCPVCSSGLTSQCETYGAFDMYSGIGKHKIRGGMISDLFLVPNAQHMLIPIPEGMNWIDLGSASDNLPDAWSRVAPELINKPGKKVLVIGGATKSVSLYAVAFAMKMKTEQVDFMDTSKERLLIAQKMGANTFRPGSKDLDNRYDLIVNGTNTSNSIRNCIAWLRPGGVCQCSNIFLLKELRFLSFKCMLRI